jgi:GTPase SAR1 family protein
VQNTFNRALAWVKELRQQTAQSVLIVLAGNKADLAAEHRAVSVDVSTVQDDEDYDDDDEDEDDDHDDNAAADDDDDDGEKDEMVMMMMMIMMMAAVG